MFTSIDFELYISDVLEVIMYDETIGKLTGAAKKKLGVLNESTFNNIIF